MSNNADPTGFGKFVPGFDFLQKLAQGGGASMAGWVAPTLDPQALDKRIDELKTVQFWLDQNAAALKATIQALEVQKMTLATLKSMNVAMPAAGTAWPAAAAQPASPADAAPASASAAAKAARTPRAASAEAPGAAMPDPMQLWGALTQQFQQIAGQAMKDLAAQSTPAPAAASAKPPAASRRPAPAPKPAARSRKKT